ERARVRGSIERFEASELRFSTVLEGLLVHAEVAVAVLPGARLAWLGCDVGDAAECTLELVLETADGFARVPVPVPFAELAPSGLSSLQLLAFGAGQLLLTAADDSDRNLRRRAFLIDPLAATWQRVDATRVPNVLFALDSGAIVEIDADGTSLRAAVSEGRYASPDGDLLGADAPYLAFAAPGQWQRDGDALRARSQEARLDLAELRFAALRLELAIAGEAEIRLYDDRSIQPSVHVTESELSLAACHVPRAAGGLVIERRGNELSVHDAGSQRTCRANISAEPLGIGVILKRDSLLQHLQVERL
ncbi:MAG: hypothetical protein RL701_7623, partial [Pseudomonadota bacterium]